MVRMHDFYTVRYFVSTKTLYSSLLCFDQEVIRVVGKGDSWELQVIQHSVDFKMT